MILASLEKKFFSQAVEKHPMQGKKSKDQSGIETVAMTRDKNTIM